MDQTTTDLSSSSSSNSTPPTTVHRPLHENEDDTDPSNIRSDSNSACKKTSRVTAPLILNRNHHQMIHQPATSVESSNSEDVQYYRITYRGIVSLFQNSDDKDDSPNLKSGAYVGYGEIIQSSHVRELDGLTNGGGGNGLFDGAGDGGGSVVSSLGNGSAQHHSSSLLNQQQRRHKLAGGRVVRVDAVLTGGYAMDATKSLALQQKSSCLGYLYTQRKGLTIAEQMMDPPLNVEVGSFSYRISSPVPIPVLLGPALDAPCMAKVKLMPSSVHEVCLRILVQVKLQQHSNYAAASAPVYFLRLSGGEKGWICDRTMEIHEHPGSRGIPKISFVAQELEQLHQRHDKKESVPSRNCDPSIASSSITSASINVNDSIPKQPISPTAKSVSSQFSTPSKTSILSSSSQTASHHRLIQTPRRLRMQGVGLLLREGDSASVSMRSAFHSSDNHHQHSDPKNSSDATIDTSTSAALSVLSEDTDTIAANTTALSISGTPNKEGSATHFADFYLFRVVAPLGLKILPHFQTNALNKRNNLSTETDVTAQNSVLPYGFHFEASKRISNTDGGLFAPGTGLIQLSDKSGWAIIPNQEELQEQFGSVGNVTGKLIAVQEVGNSVTSSIKRTWLRVLPSNGLLVSCPPSSKEAHDADGKDFSPISSSAGSSIYPTKPSYHTTDSDGASSVGGQSGFSEFSRMAKSRKGQSQLNPIVIPCGNCIEVEDSIPFSEISNNESSPGILVQRFARIAGGQGWIPWHLDGEDFAIFVEEPEVRQGSIWFRVQSKRGTVVRQGPSVNALPILSASTGDEFRFECGEFLRASEVLTVFYMEGRARYSESFARLYRKFNVKRQQKAENDLKVSGILDEANRHTSLEELSAPGEWVPVHVRGNLFLEECAAVPSVERHRAGWRYNAVLESGVEVRRGPSFLADKTNVILRAGQSVLVIERVMAHADQVTWLRLKEGGWVNDTEEDGRVVMIAHSQLYRSRGGKNGGKKGDTEIKGLISKLFSDTASSIISL